MIRSSSHSVFSRTIYSLTQSNPSVFISSTSSHYNINHGINLSSSSFSTLVPTSIQTENKTQLRKVPIVNSLNGSNIRKITLEAKTEGPVEQPINPYRFRGKTAIVTGGVSGIGEASVIEFLNEGANVGIFDINVKGATDLIQRLKKKQFKGRLEFYEVDISNKDRCFEAVSQFAKLNGGKIHCLVNNAVYFGSKGMTANPSDFQKTYSINIAGTASMTQACHKYMVAAGGKHCAIVNMASTTGWIAHPQRWTYSSSKAAIVSLTRCMARDLGVDGIRVNCITPSWIWTPEVAKAAVDGGREKWEPVWGKCHMLRRIGEASEVARVILFLCSSDSSFITGSDIKVDGGYLGLGPEGLGENTKFVDYD